MRKSMPGELTSSPMSLRTLSRLPPHVAALVGLYSKAVERHSLYPSRHVQSYLQKSSGEYQRFQIHKLRNNAFDSRDFPPLISKTIRKIFEQPLQLRSGEQISSDVLVHKLFPQHDGKPTGPESIHSYSHRTTKQTSDYTARLATTLASFYDPLQSVPPVASLQNSMQWYRKLLQNTPIVLVLRKKHRLFSDASLEQLDLGTVQMAQKVNHLGNAIAQGPGGDTATRSYHFTNLATTDLFGLALQELTPSGHLADAIHSDEPRVVDLRGSTVAPSTVDHYLQHHPAHELARTVGRVEGADDMGQLIPFDLEFPVHHLLTIENPVVERDHQALFAALDASDFDVVAARISLAHPAIHHFFTALARSTDKPLNYTQLLASASASKAPVHTLMTRLAACGLLHTEEAAGAIHLYRAVPAE